MPQLRPTLYRQPRPECTLVLEWGRETLKSYELIQMELIISLCLPGQEPAQRAIIMERPQAHLTKSA
jgi:hypothetical protein